MQQSMNITFILLSIKVISQSRMVLLSIFGGRSFCRSEVTYLFMYLFIDLFIYLFIYYLFIYLFIYLFLTSFIYLFICLFI